jgi:ComF family protein
LSILASALAAALPQDCLLCGRGPSPGLLCGACAAGLPRLPAGRCPVCAEAVPVQEAPVPCGGCLAKPPAFAATTAALRYAFPLDKLVQALKYGHRLAVAGFLAEVMLAGSRPAGDVVVPVPLSPVRLRERGFNQSVEIARPLARALGLPLLLDGCTRRLDTAPQATLPWKVRRKNVRHAFECAVDLTDRHVIAVDDVMTTGATLDEFARELRAHGAASVHNWVAARALRN